MGADPKKLADLREKASSALFELHDYMRQCDDLWWREIYRHRVEMSVLVDARVQAWNARKEPAHARID